MKFFLFSASILTFCKLAVAQPELTLTGQTKIQAISARTDYLNYNSSASKKTTSVWFKKTVINKMITLLQGEKGPNGEIIDGIRIYYANFNNQNSVFFVSTYQKTVPGRTYHQDYFNHDINNPVFTDPDISGTATNTPSNYGLTLYGDCGSPCSTDANCPPPAGSLHYITRKHSEDLVHNLRDNYDFPSTRCEWFPLCFFSNIPASDDGLRIYFGKHLDTDPTPFTSLDTFVIELTSMNNGVETDSFDCYYPCSNAIDLQLSKYFSKSDLKSKKHSMINKINNFKLFVRINGVDNGELCPSHCDGVSLP